MSQSDALRQADDNVQCIQVRTSASTDLCVKASISWSVFPILPLVDRKGFTIRFAHLCSACSIAISSAKRYMSHPVITFRVQLSDSCVFPQDNGLVPIVEPEILLDGEHDIDRTLEVAMDVWSHTFKYLAENNVLFEGILLKPSMVTPGAQHKNRPTPEQVADYTLTLLRRRVPPAVPGIMVSSERLALKVMY